MKMEPFLFGVEPAGAALVKDPLGDPLRLSKLLKGVVGREFDVRNAKRLENLSLRRLNKALVVQKPPPTPREDRKSIFFFHNLSSPDSAAHSPGERVSVLTKHEDRDNARYSARANSNMVHDVLKGNNTNRPLSKSHHSTSSNSLNSLSNVHTTTKSLFGAVSQQPRAPETASESTIIHTDSTIAKKVQSTTSLFAKHQPAPKQETTKLEYASSDDDDDSEWMDSDWSSQCDSSDDEHEDMIKFEKVGEPAPPLLKRSLLSGMLLNQLDKPDVGIQGNINPKLVLSPSENAKANSIKSISPIMQTTSPKHTGGGVPAISEVHKAAPVRGLSSQISMHAQPVVNKSAVSLTSFYASNRRPAASNAPPSAATLLPTALATHMFLPTRGERHDPVYNHHSQSHNIHSHHLAHHAQHPQHPHSKQALSSRSSSTTLELTHANLAQLSSIYPGHNSNSNKLSESVTSFKSSSIDIPGKQSRLRREKELERARERERQELLRQKSQDPNSHIDILERELPLNLVDSLYNENKAFGGEMFSGVHAADASQNPHHPHDLQNPHDPNNRHPQPPLNYHSSVW